MAFERLFLVLHFNSPGINHIEALTHWYLGDLNNNLDNFQVNFSDWLLRYLL